MTPEKPFGSPSVLAASDSRAAARLQGEFPCSSRLPSKRVVIPVVVFSLLSHSTISINHMTPVTLCEFSSIGFCGSRSIPASARPIVSSVVQEALSTTRASLSIGCSIGADSFVLSSLPRAILHRLTIFAAFGFDGEGSCSLSAVNSVLGAVRHGAFVHWWAGGPLSVPLNQRLALRSVALVRHIASSPPAALISFLSSPDSRGSLIGCRRAAPLGVTVIVFCIGFSPTQLPLLRGGGGWSPVQIAGQEAVRWHPPK